VKLLSRLPAFNLTLNSGLPDPWRDEAQQSNLTSDSSHNAPTPLAGEFGGEFPAG
jgi:hypothetical protein